MQMQNESSFSWIGDRGSEGVLSEADSPGNSGATLPTLPTSFRFEGMRSAVQGLMVIGAQPGGGSESAAWQVGCSLEEAGMQRSCLAVGAECSRLLRSSSTTTVTGPIAAAAVESVRMESGSPLRPRGGFDQSRRMRRSSVAATPDAAASHSGPPSDELFSFKMRDHVNAVGSDERCSSPTLFLGFRPTSTQEIFQSERDSRPSPEFFRPSKSYSEVRAEDPDRLSTASRPSHIFSDEGTFGARERFSGSSTAAEPSSGWARWAADLDAPRPSESPRLSASRLLEEQAEEQVQRERAVSAGGTGGQPVSVPRIHSVSGYSTSAPKPHPKTLASMLARGTASVGNRQLGMDRDLLGLPWGSASDHDPNLGEEQLRAHAVVFARAKGISLEDATSQLMQKSARAGRKGSGSMASATEQSGTRDSGPLLPDLQRSSS